MDCQRIMNGAMRPWWHNVEIGLRLGLNRKPIKT